MRMNLIEPRYRIDSGQPIVDVEARCLKWSNRMQSLRAIRGTRGRRVFRGLHMNLGDPQLLELTTPASTAGQGGPNVKVAGGGVGGAHSNDDGKDNITSSE